MLGLRDKRREPSLSVTTSIIIIRKTSSPLPSGGTFAHFSVRNRLNSFHKVYIWVKKVQCFDWAKALCCFGPVSASVSLSFLCLEAAAPSSSGSCGLVKHLFSEFPPGDELNKSRPGSLHTPISPNTSTQKVFSDLLLLDIRRENC